MYHEQLFRGKKVNTQYINISNLKLILLLEMPKIKLYVWGFFGFFVFFFFFFRKTYQGLTFLLKNKLITTVVVVYLLS